MIIKGNALNSKLEESSLVKLEKVLKSDTRFLFNLLKERDKKTNISHKSMPTFSQHENFVLSKPYKVWYTIKWKNKKVGSIYLSKQDEIGIHMNKNSAEMEIMMLAIEILTKKNPRKRYLVNVNPKNTKLMQLMKKCGFKLIQHTFELAKNKYQKVS